MKQIISFRLFLLIATLLFITSCSNKQSMKPEDFKDQNPRLIIEDYLSGNVKAWGILQNRSGKVTRQFSAELNGKWDGKQLILDEKFNWSDGEVQTRQWQITKIDEHNYEGTAGDVVGKARGYSYGPAFKFEYVLLVPVKGREMKIDSKEIDSISFTGYGVYGLGYDSWFESKIYFQIDLNNGKFRLTPDNDEHKKYPQQGNCINKDSGKK